MHVSNILVIITICVALAFDFINGFHDAANSIATVVSTRVLTPTLAILMAAVCNIAGAMIATTVATTIAKGIVDPSKASEALILAAVIGAIGWNIITSPWSSPRI